MPELPNNSCGPDCDCGPDREPVRPEKRANLSIYLDHAATTPVRAQVVETMLPFFSDEFGNPSSVHSFGKSSAQALAAAREVVASCIGADPREIVFTGSGTESDNLAIKGAATALRDRGRHLIVSCIEHHAVLEACEALAAMGFEITHLPVDGAGAADPSALEDLIRPDTILVSMMAANNETGVIQPVSEIAEIARGKGAAFHTDAVQALGKIPVDVEEIGADMLSISAHKIGGPKGTGALYVRRGTRLSPIIHGGRQEHGRRAGTENVPLILGMAKAMDLASGELEQNARYMAALRDRLEDATLKSIDNAAVNGGASPRLPNISNIAFESVEAEAALISLDRFGIAASAGSACTAGAVEPSHVLRAMGVDPALARGSLRFSIGYDNTEADIDAAVAALSEIIPRLRERGHKA